MSGIAARLRLGQIDVLGHPTATACLGLFEETGAVLTRQHTPYRHKVRCR